MADQLYDTINGPRTLGQMQTELQAAGWPGPPGGTLGAGSIANAYAQTAGGSVTPSVSSSPASTTGGGGGGAVVPQTAGGGADLSALTSAFNAAGTMSAADLAERKRQFDATLEWQKQMWANQGLPQLVIQQRAQQLQQDEFAFQSQMAQQSAALQKAGVLGYMEQGATPVDPAQFDRQDAATKAIYLQYNGNDQAAAARKWAQDATAATTAAGGGPTKVPTLAAQQQAFQQVLGLGGLNLQQQQTALDAIKTAASLGGPENFISAVNFARGVNQTDVPVFLRNLVQGVGAPAATGGVGLSAPQSFGGIAARLGAGGTTTAPASNDLAQTLAMGRQLFSQGGAGLAPGSLENMSDTEMKMLGSVGQAVGGDLPTFLRQYATSRVGQGAAQAA